MGVRSSEGRGQGGPQEEPEFVKIPGKGTLGRGVGQRSKEPDKGRSFPVRGQKGGRGLELSERERASGRC